MKKSEIRNKKSEIRIQNSGVGMVLFCILTFTGCQQGSSPPPSAQQVKKEAPKPAELPPAVETKEEKKEEVTSDIKKKNPFKPFLTNVKEKKAVVPTTPLQKYELDQLKLVAVVWGVNGSVAMVEAPDGKGYSVKRGDLIGRRGGRVKRIEKNMVVVEERFTEATGEGITSEFTIKLPLPKEEEEIL
jgi:type IV pilus assembly protein PilP